MSPQDSPLVLVTGASGYVGGRLVPALLEVGARVRAGGRHPEAMSDRSWAEDAELVEMDLSERMQVRRALDGVDAVVFLVHAMGGGAGYADREARMARIMAEEAERAGVGRIVYLSGLHPNLPEEELSEHMASRERVAQILAEGGVPTLVVQAATVIGGGSASFEIIRHLADLLPVMPAPCWVNNRIEPVAIADVLHYLVAAVMAPEPVDGAYALGSGQSELRFADLLIQYAEEAGLRRRRVLGLPVLRVWEAKQVVVFKRGMSAGYAGVQNPLFFEDNTQMLFGDAKASVQAILGALDKGGSGDPAHATTAAPVTAR